MLGLKKKWLLRKIHSGGGKRKESMHSFHQWRQQTVVFVKGLHWDHLAYTTIARSLVRLWVSCSDVGSHCWTQHAGFALQEPIAETKNTWWIHSVYYSNSSHESSDSNPSFGRLECQQHKCLWEQNVKTSNTAAGQGAYFQYWRAQSWKDWDILFCTSVNILQQICCRRLRARTQPPTSQDSTEGDNKLSQPVPLWLRQQ